MTVRTNKFLLHESYVGFKTLMKTFVFLQYYDWTDVIVTSETLQRTSVKLEFNKKIFLNCFVKVTFRV